MSSNLNARFKNLVGSRRRSSNQSPQNNTQVAPQLSPSNASAASSSSTTSLPMNPHNQNNLGRPPSYTYAPPGQLGAPPPSQQQQQQQHGRPTSPLPPINTQGHGYPPQAPLYQQPAPPGYPAQQQPYGGYGVPNPPQPQPAATQQYQRPGAVEVDGVNRSKAQLIVGIDFVGDYYSKG